MGPPDHRAWWWDVQYEDTVAQNTVHTANELHIPVKRVVVLKVQSHDVIHSFWAPSLGVKKDLIPGHPGETRLIVLSFEHMDFGQWHRGSPLVVVTVSSLARTLCLLGCRPALCGFPTEDTPREVYM